MTVDEIPDLRPVMEESVKRLAIDEPALSRQAISSRVYAEHKEDRVSQKLSTTKMANLVSTTRRTEHGDWQSAIMMAPLVTINVNDNFLQFNLHQNLRQKDTSMKISQMIGWCNPALKFHARQRGIRLFVDGTFSIAPHPFKQCVTLSAYSEVHKFYFTFFYILLMSKLHVEYFAAFQAVIVSLEWVFDPSTVTGDYEVGLINACKEQFCDGQKNPIQYVGCEFHLIAANTKKAIDIGIHSHFAFKIMWSKDGIL